jgi:hypothetical protein
MSDEVPDRPAPTPPASTNVSGSPAMRTMHLLRKDVGPPFGVLPRGRINPRRSAASAISLVVSGCFARRNTERAASKYVITRAVDALTRTPSYEAR